MLRIMRIGIFFMIAGIALVSGPFAAAKEGPNPAVAPIPVQILNARKVFISNGGNIDPFGTWSVSQSWPYNRFYAAMKNWGRFDLVPTPGDADLVLEIAYTGGLNFSQLRLTALDSRSRIVLWALAEDVGAAATRSGKQKQLEKSMAALVVDVQRLVNPTLPGLESRTPAK